jgi:hypothetical protein
MGLGARDEGPTGRRDRKSNNSYISKSRRNSSVEPSPQPPRHGDHQRRSRRQSHDEPEGGAAGFRAVRFFWRFWLAS